MAFPTSRSPRGGCWKFPIFDNSFLGEDTTPYEIVFVDDPDEDSEGTNDVRVSFPPLVDRQGEVCFNLRRPAALYDEDNVWERGGEEGPAAGTLGRGTADGAGFADGSERLRVSPIVGTFGGDDESDEEGG